MQRLILFRHAPALVEPEKSSIDWELESNVENQILPLLEGIDTRQLTKIVTSSQTKAVQTAEVISSALDLPVSVLKGLEEHHRSKEDFVESHDQFEERLQRFFDNPDSLIFGKETANQACKRFTQTVVNLLSKSKGDELVVSHGTVTSLFLAQLTDKSAMEIWQGLKHPDIRLVEGRELNKVKNLPF